MLPTNRTDELAEQAAGTVYHCESACAALANRSVTRPPSVPASTIASTYRPPTPGRPAHDSLPTSLLATPFVITSIHFTLKAASTGVALTARNESRASHIFTTDCHLSAPPSPSPPHRHYQPASVRHAVRFAIAVPRPFSKLFEIDERGLPSSEKKSFKEKKNIRTP